MLKNSQKSQISLPYVEEEIFYENSKAGIMLAGTLALPASNGPHPVALLISGMGRTDRNATTPGEHKPFLVLSDHLARHGIAVLRFDKRGVGKSMGTFDFSLTSADFASDVCAGVAYLKTRPEINHSQIGLIGHSEGGFIATIVAAQSSDIAFMVSLAGVVLTDVATMLDATAQQLCADGASHALIEQNINLRKHLFSIIKQDTTLDTVEKKLLEVVERYWEALPADLKQESSEYHFALTKSNAARSITMMNSLWYRYLLTSEPVKLLEKIKVPVLALYGTLDHIISSKLALPAIDEALKKSGNQDYILHELIGLNHQLQTSVTGALKEYAMIEEAMAPIALNIITTWILQKTVNRYL